MKSSYYYYHFISKITLIILFWVIKSKCSSISKIMVPWFQLSLMKNNKNNVENNKWKGKKIVKKRLAIVLSKEMDVENKFCWIEIGGDPMHLAFLYWTLPRNNFSLTRSSGFAWLDASLGQGATIDSPRQQNQRFL